MIQIWNNYKFSTWNISIKDIPNISIFDRHLQSEFKKVHNYPTRPPESNGDAYSVNDIGTIVGFNDLFNSLNLNYYLTEFDAHNFVKIKRAWANRMHKNSFGSVHKHGANLKVLIIYYNVPEGSSDLILIHPKYKILCNSNSIAVPDEYKYSIKVKEGMCILHHGDMLHAVSKHLSDLPRDAIIIELEAVNKE